MAPIVVCINRPVGAGKSALIKAVAQKLKTTDNIRTHLASEPIHLGSDWYGENLLYNGTVELRNGFLFQTVALTTLLDLGTAEDVNLVLMERSKDTAQNIFCDAINRQSGALTEPEFQALMLMAKMIDKPVINHSIFLWKDRSTPIRTLKDVLFERAYKRDQTPREWTDVISDKYGEFYNSYEGSPKTVIHRLYTES